MRKLLIIVFIMLCSALVIGQMSEIRPAASGGTGTSNADSITGEVIDTTGKADSYILEYDATAGEWKVVANSGGSGTTELLIVRNQAGDSIELSTQNRYLVATDDIDFTLSGDTLAYISIKSDAIGTDKIQAQAVQSSDIYNGTIATIDLADGIVTTIKLANDAVDSTKLADKAVRPTHMDDQDHGDVTYSGGVATLDHFPNDSIPDAGVLIGNGTLWTPRHFSGDITMQGDGTVNVIMSDSATGAARATTIDTTDADFTTYVGNHSAENTDADSIHHVYVTPEVPSDGEGWVYESDSSRYIHATFKTLPAFPDPYDDYVLAIDSVPDTLKWVEMTGGGGSGDITEVVAGDGLTGGGPTGSVTLEVGAGAGIAVTADAIAISDGSHGDLTYSSGDATIVDDVVDTSLIKSVNQAVDEDILTFESTTGDFEYHTPTELGLAIDGGAHHDGFSDFVANEHIDWTQDQGATNIHSGNYVVNEASDVDTTGTKIAAALADREDQLNNEAGLYAALSDVTDFVQTSELNYTDSTDVNGWNYFNTEGELTTLLDNNYQPLEVTLTDIADGTVNEGLTFSGNMVNTANPWADNEVADDITVSGYFDTAAINDTNALFIRDADLNSEAELESQLIGVTDVYTNNDGSLDDDNVTLADVQSACTNDFHNIGGTDDDVPESGDFGNAADLGADGSLSNNAVDNNAMADNAVTTSEIVNQTIVKSDIDTTGYMTFQGVFKGNGATASNQLATLGELRDTVWEVIYDDTVCIASFTIVDPDSLEDLYSRWVTINCDVKWAYTITEIRIDARDPITHTFEIEEWTHACADSGTETLVDAVALATSCSKEETTISDASIAAGSRLVLDLGTSMPDVMEISGKVWAVKQ